MRTVVRLAAIVLWDIVVSNLTVARIVLWPGADPQPAWVRVPLQLQHPGAISLLATIITNTPGTVSCVVDEERGEILVHALDCQDPEALAAQIKSRYEQPLREIFG
jgi:multicomponent K+:H+ antiporter subunit E